MPSTISGSKVVTNEIENSAGANPYNTTLVVEQATTSTASIDFLDIPSGVKEITIMLKGVSSNGTSRYMIQLGDATGGIENSGYTGQAHNQGASGAVANSSGFNIQQAASAGELWSGAMILVLEKASTFSWISTGLFNDGTTVTSSQTMGAKSLSHELDRIRLTTAGGSETFDAGAISIQYE